MAKLDEWTRYYGGEVKKVNKGGGLDILFDDGDRQRNVPRRCICRPGEVPPDTPAGAQYSQYEAPLAPSSKFIVGDRISCKIAGWNSWYDGYVTVVNADLTYVIRFDDGEVVSTVREKEMMPITINDGSSAPPRPSSQTIALPDYVQLNSRVEARCEGWHKFYIGTVQSISPDRFFCSILFDDGELRPQISASEIRPARTKSQSKIVFDLSHTVAEDSVYAPESEGKKKNLKVGMKVMANPFSEWTKAYAGVIEHRMNDGTFAILFDDGERVAGVEADDIDIVSKSHSEGPSMEFEEESEWHNGQHVEAKVQGWRKYYPGKIQRANTDGTFIIEFLDGEVIHDVKPDEIRKSRVRAETTGTEVTERPNSPDQVFKLGERVAAKLFVGEVKWRKYWGGEVVRCNEDGSYKIVFDDGEIYSQVWPVEIKKPKPGSALATPILKPPPPEYFDVGERVEVKTLNWKSWYPGLVEKRNDDDTYIVQFDDGERLLDIKLGEIRRLIKAKHHEPSDDEDEDED